MEITVKRRDLAGDIVYPNGGGIIRNDDIVFIADKIIDKALGIEAAGCRRHKLHGSGGFRAKLGKGRHGVLRKSLFGVLRQLDAACAVIPVERIGLDIAFFVCVDIHTAVAVFIRPSETPRSGIVIGRCGIVPVEIGIGGGNIQFWFYDFNQFFHIFCRWFGLCFFGGCGGSGDIR